ncbi:MAG: Crp/Fnr family transcriptional regulator [Anaerolineae bacterium]|nr:Crp/Fnr family transcriptional regulator [Anaerolineae bacterium]
MSNYLSNLADEMDFVSEIPEEELAKALKGLRTITVKKDGYFLRAGEVPGRIGFLKAGLMRLFYIDLNGVEVNKHFCIENTVASSYSAFLQQAESKFFIQALEDTELRTIDYETYRALLNGHICWQIVAKKLAEMIFIMKEKREAELLLCDAQERYQQFLTDYPGLERRIAQYHIASYLGITPESLSRIRASLREINIDQ